MANDYTKIALQLQKYGTVQGLMKYINNGSKESFDFLGIRHINGKNRKGNYKLVHKTSKKKMKVKKQKVKT